MRRLLQRISLYAFHVCFARPILRWVVGVRYRRRQMIPEGPCLVVANHNSHLDAAVLMSLFPLGRLSHVHPVAAADYFGSNWFMSMMAMFFMNGIPIERRPARGADPLAPIAELLKAGETLVFFPEGSRGEPGVVAKFRPGIGRLVQEVPGLLVVPVFLSGPERIWPRGEPVPVPLNVDAIVGKPRSYSPDADPREIADRVRRDVLALAPPPPPRPGERVAPPLHVAICGIDERAVGELFRTVTERLGAIGTTLGIAEPVLEADGRGVRETVGPLPVDGGRTSQGLLSSMFRTGPRRRGRRFDELVDRARIGEALRLGHATRFVVERGSALADLLAEALVDMAPADEEHELRDLMQYLTGARKVPLRRAWRLIRGAPAIWLISTLGLARATVPELLVRLTASPAEVMQRLRSSGQGLSPHQNEADLERLQQAQARTAEMLRRRRKIRVLELDPAGCGPDGATLRIEAACRELEAERNASRES